MTLSTLSQMLSQKSISSVELTETYLRAVEAVNPDIGAYISVSRDTALEAAAEADKRYAKGEPRGALDGIPCVVKDNISTAGIKTTCASAMLKDYVPFFDAFVWKKLKENGAVLLGKGNMDEFAMGSTTETSHFYPAKNPIDTSRVPGGSSGGVAAAVAANIAAYGIGSDTGGSIRQPASFCGMTGLKPTYGAVSRNGLIAYGSSLDQIGPICKSAQDIAEVFSVIRGHDPLDMTSADIQSYNGGADKPVSEIKIGIAEELFNNVSPDVAAAIQAAIGVLTGMGVEFVPVDIPALKYSLPAYYIIACAEASSNLSRFDGIRYGSAADSYVGIEDLVCKTRSANFGIEVQRRIMLGNYVLSAGYFDAYYGKAQAVRERLKADFALALDKCDMLISPITPSTAFKLGAQMSPVETYQTDICTVPVNLTGLPAISVPCGVDSQALPVGMQLIGRHFADDALVRLAAAYERETDYAHIAGTEMGVRL